MSRGEAKKGRKDRPEPQCGRQFRDSYQRVSSRAAVPRHGAPGWDRGPVLGTEDFGLLANAVAAAAFRSVETVVGAFHGVGVAGVARL